MVRDLATAEPQRDLALVAVIEKAPNIAHLDVVVTVVGAWAELDFFDFNDRLLGLGFRRALLLLVLELAVVHQATHGWHGGSSDFDQIHIQFAGHAQRFCDADDAQRLIFRTVEANLRGHDFSVQAVCALFALAAVTKVGSYGGFLNVGQLNKKTLG